MTRHVAFLSAINVGGHTVPMSHLRGLFESLGFANVEASIASGNVIFESKEKDTAKLVKKLAVHLEAELGYGVETFVGTLQDAAAIEKRCRFSPKERDDLVYVAFLHKPLKAGAKSALKAGT